MTIPSAPIPSGRPSLIRQVATAAAVLAAVLATVTIPAAAAPSSIAPPPSTGTTVPPTTGVDTRDGTGNRDSTGTGDGYTLILDVPSTAVQGTTIAVHGGSWLCSKVTVTPGWTTSATTVTVTSSYMFDTTVTVPTSAPPGKSTLTATCTADSSITATKPITVLAARKVTTAPIVTSEAANPTPPTADAQAPENKSGTSSVGPLAVGAALILAAIVGAVTLLGRRTSTPESPASGSSRVPGPAPGRSRETDTAEPGVWAPGAAPFGRRRTAESPRFGSPAPSPRHAGRVPDVQVRVHQDRNPRLDIRTFPSRPPNVQIRVHRAEPITTVREVPR
ncbi:hypothetical protein [Nocardia sp. CA-135398]|uniref:hypothetical protein n=1 Tax=Nocardia sp. CA-135398 TaxID=3239977 RepID=UPI003D96661C